MAGTIVVDRIESDASYASTINVAGQITFSNTVNFGAFAGTAPVAGFYLPTTNNLAFTTASTERMRIDSAGNMGIGTSSPVSQLHLAKTSDLVFTQSGYGISWGGADNGSPRIYGSSAGIGGVSGYLAFKASTGSEAMRIDASGNVGIGTSSPSARVDVRTAALGTALLLSDDTNYGANFIGISGGLKLAMNGTQTFAIFQSTNERMRIDSSGNLLVGATSFPSTSSKFFVAGTAISQNGVIQAQSNTAGDVSYSALYLSKFDNNSTTSQILVRFAINNYGAGQGQINGNGANAAAFGTFSDSRLKENIVDLPSQLSNIMALRPVEYDYIASEGGGHQIGFVAQEVQAVYPDLVGEREDGMLTLSDMNKNDARIIKAIQEQQALITSLTARITALESN